MERYRSKMQEFVAKLWHNPNIQQLPLGRKENHILGFIQENRDNLQQAFKTEGFFPEISWDDAVRLLLTVLTDSILDMARPLIDELLERVNHPELRDHFASEGGLNVDTIALRDYILDKMRNKRMRDQYISVLASLEAGFYRRYLPPVISYRKLIYIELVRRDHLGMSADVVADYVALAALFRPLGSLPIDTASQSGDVLMRHQPNSRSYKEIYNQIRDQVNTAANHVPDSLLETGLHSSLSVLDHPDIPGSSRLINIFSTRAQEYVANQKLDRGAETPDKSWFNINRRTARLSGMDVRFLEELYLIAGEEGW
ncbi:MAG: hypothetical protein KDK39_05865 [Leptospiraceae bacterium]|nr:hypothetical protein [Leptospiraceae bacterium]